MIIANPIFDVVFKRLMQDEKVAKFFISTLLGQPVVSLSLLPQERVLSDTDKTLRLYRLDFVANIRLEDGSLKKVLIEVQKSLESIDIMRFRNYLADQYKTLDLMMGKPKPLPITTIYLLGDNVPGIETPCLRVERVYTDMVNNKIVETRSDFIEKLTHDSYVVQMGRTNPKVNTVLSRLLSIFEQDNFADDKGVTKYYVESVEDEGIKRITDILQFVGTNPEERQRIEGEQEVWRTYYAHFGEKEDELAQKVQAHLDVIVKQNQTIEQQNKVVEEQSRAIEEQQKVMEDQQKAMEDQQKAMEDQQKAMEDQQKAMEEKAMEDQQKAIEDQQKAIERQQKDMDELRQMMREQMRMMEEQRRTAAEKDQQIEALRRRLDPDKG